MDETCCPLCLEEFDPTDLLLAPRLCQCRFAVCLWCFRRLTEDAAKEGRQALCPKCRGPYDTERIAREGRELNPEQLEEVKRKKSSKDDKRRSSTSSRPRKDLANVRVVQRNLVYVVGLPMECCFEDVLSSQDYIGQFGKIVKISVSRSGPYGSTQAKNGPTGSAYVTFKRVEDARRCIESIHGTTWEGRVVKACYGTTKYCNAFLKGQACNNTDCLYLHDVAMEEDSYTKEETKSTKFVNLVHAASLNQASSAVSSNLGGTTGLTDLNSAYSGFDQDGPTAMEDDLADAHGWPSLSNSAWSKQHSHKMLNSQQSIPLTDDPHAWPGLPGGAGSTSGNVTTNPSSAETSETEADVLHARRSSLSHGTTMAVKLAQASSSKDQAKDRDQPRRLTPLPSRHKPQTSLDSTALPSTTLIEPKDLSRLSPPPTPQLQSSRAVQKLMSPDHEELDEAPPASAEQSGTSRPTSFSRNDSVRTSTADSVDSVTRPPPGFAHPSVRPKAVVQPPPGFADVPASSTFTSHTFSDPILGSILPSNADCSDSASFQQASSRSGLGNDGGQVQWGTNSQRTRSRFAFAQRRESAPQPPNVSNWDDRPAQSGGHAHDHWQSNGIFGGAFGVNGASLYNTLPIPYPAAYTILKDDWKTIEELPAGLALLKRLQAQGGVARESECAEQEKILHSIFADPAVMSATSQTSDWSSKANTGETGIVSGGVESQDVPKLKPSGRRRKIKASHD